mgnify:FL=1
MLIIFFVTGLILFTVDKELKYLDKLGIKKSNLVTIKKMNYFFFYQNRKEKIITSFVLINTVIYYIMNLAALVLLTLHFITRNKAYYIASCIMSFMNILIIVEIGLKISLNKDQQKIKLEDQKNK